MYRKIQKYYKNIQKYSLAFFNKHYKIVNYRIMSKTIAIIVNELTADYTQEIITSVSDYYQNKDVKLIVSQVKLPITKDTDFDYQYWSLMSMLDNDEVDAYIILSAIFASYLSPDELKKHLKNFSKKKIISVSVPLDLKNCYSTKLSCDDSYDEIISHLVTEHNKTRIAFASAHKTGSVEALERLEGYKKALEKNGLSYDDSLIFDGVFTYQSIYSDLQKKLKTKEDVKFDAILAANDMMAFACIDYITGDLGMKVPEDVAVFGYDDILQAETAETSLSTINQQIYRQGQKAAELALKACENEDIPLVTEMNTKVIYRKSCGCTHTSTSDVRYFVNKYSEKSVNATIVSHLESMQFQNDIYFLMDAIQSETTLENLFAKFDILLPVTVIPTIAVCMYEEPIIYQNPTQFDKPYRAKLSLIVDKDKNLFIPNMDVFFNPRITLIPDGYFEDEPGNYMIHPIFNGDKQYGYMVSKIAASSLILDIIYLKVYSNVISQSYKYTKQLEAHALLDEQSKTDVLTGIFNRRGLLEEGQKLIDSSLAKGESGIICFGDMDKLKYINDTFGHEMGDAAIKGMGVVLQEVIGKDKVIGRLGGDEFAFVMNNFDLENFASLKEDVNKLCKKYSKQKKFPFEIQVSLGAVQYSEGHKNLSRLITKADKEQYKDKQSKNVQRKA